MLGSAIPILLVEDDEIDSLAIRRQLQKARLENPLFNVCDGIEALDLLTGNGTDKLPQPCLILLDINMPRLNGFGLLEAIQQNEHLKKNIVFMLTTSSREEDVNKAYRLNASGYVLKKNLAELADMLSDYFRINPFPGFAQKPASQ